MPALASVTDIEMTDSAHYGYHDLYCATVAQRGGDPNIGPRLPVLLKRGGFEEVGVGIVQPVGTEGRSQAD